MAIITCASVTATVSTAAAATEKTAQTVVVQSGQTLWSIANSHHMSVNALLKLNPSVHSQTIQPGMRLVVGYHSRIVSESAARKAVVVQSGDTLWSISKTYHTTVDAMMRMNPQLHGSQVIQAGTRLYVPARRTAASVVSHHSGVTVRRTASLSSRDAGFGPAGASQDADNLYWMAHVIHAEANGQPINTQIAVGDVVWHRMLGQPGSTVKDIVFQQSNGSYQFSTVPEGYIYSTPDAQSETAAVDVLEYHKDLVPGAYVFYGVHQTNDSWVLSQPVIATIGDMVFAK